MIALCQGTVETVEWAGLSPVDEDHTGEVTGLDPHTLKMTGK